MMNIVNLEPETPLLSGEADSDMDGYQSILAEKLTTTSSIGHVRKLGVWSVCFITYFNVAGGPWGGEEIISDAGPLAGIIGMILFPLIWGLPLALITAELSTKFPQNGGYSIWVSEAFGGFWGFQESYWSWISGVVDSAVYPVLAFQMLIKAFYNGKFNFWLGWLLKSGLALLWTLPNLFHIEILGRGLSFLTAFTIIPFVVFVIITLSKGSLDFNRLGRISPISEFSGYSDLVNVLYWNFSGFDCSSTFAGEVRSPRKSYPKGLLMSLVLVSVTYMFPLVAATLRDDADTWASWEEGSFSTIMRDQVGVWMMHWVVVASFVSNFGMYAAEVFEDSWQLHGMAEVGLAPSIFAYLSPTFKTPWVAVLTSYAIVVVLVSFDFNFILTIDNFFSVASALLEISAFVKLRWDGGVRDEGKVFYVPLGWKSIVVALILPVSLGVFILASSILNSVESLVINACGLLFGVVCYYFMTFNSNFGYVEQDISPSG